MGRCARVSHYFVLVGIGSTAAVISVIDFMYQLDNAAFARRHSPFIMRAVVALKFG